MEPFTRMILIVSICRFQLEVQKTVDTVAWKGCFSTCTKTTSSCMSHDSLLQQSSFLAALAALYLTLVSQWVSATLEFWHKEWLLTLETLQTFGRSDVQTSLWSNVWRVWSVKSHSLCQNSKVAPTQSLTDWLTKVRYRAARAAKNVSHPSKGPIAHS